MSEKLTNPEAGAELLPVAEPRLFVYSKDEAKDEIETGWEEPKGKTTAKYSRGLDDSIADNFQGNDFKTLREAIADGDELVVLVGAGTLHADLRWQEKRADGGIMAPEGGDVTAVKPMRLYIYATGEDKDDIKTSWEKPEVPTTAMYSVGLEDSVADDFQGSEFKKVKEVLGDGDELVVVKGGGTIHAEVRWAEKK